MASSSHTHSFHLNALYTHDCSLRIDYLLSNRPSLSEFDAALVTIKDDFTDSPGVVSPPLETAVQRLAHKLGWPSLEWAGLSLDIRKKLVGRVLPSVQDKCHSVEGVRKQLTLAAVGSHLGIRFRKEQTAHGGTSLIYDNLAALEKAAGLSPALGISLLAELTADERDALREVCQTGSAEYTPVQQLLIAIHGAGDQAQYDVEHSRYRNHLLSSRPFPLASDMLDRSLITTIRDSISTTLRRVIADKPLAAAWGWAMLREFNPYTLASLTQNEGNRLSEYFTGMSEKRFPVYYNPHQIVYDLLFSQGFPRTLSTHHSMHSLGGTRRRILTDRQAARYGRSAWERQ